MYHTSAEIGSTNSITKAIANSINLLQWLYTRVDVRREGYVPSLALPSVWQGKARINKEGSFHINSTFYDKIGIDKKQFVYVARYRGQVKITYGKKKLFI